MKEKLTNINIVPKEGVQVIEIREGAALPVKEPQKICIVGQIDAISRYVSQRKNVDKTAAVILVNRDKMTIVLDEDPKSAYCNSVKGVLELSEDFKKWGINTEVTYAPEELADHIRMNRLAFEKYEQANKLVSEMRNFRAKIEKQIEDKDDKRGNTATVRRQTVTSNLPEKFKLKLSIFKGQKPVSIEVEIEINPSTLECYLISPQAQEVIDGTKNTIIDAEIKLLAGFCIIEQ
jgi:hypothetical protein